MCLVLPWRWARGLVRIHAHPNTVAHVCSFQAIRLFKKCSTNQIPPAVFANFPFHESLSIHANLFFSARYLVIRKVFSEWKGFSYQIRSAVNKNIPVFFTRLFWQSYQAFFVVLGRQIADVWTTACTVLPSSLWVTPWKKPSQTW